MACKRRIETFLNHVRPLVKPSHPCCIIRPAVLRWGLKGGKKASAAPWLPGNMMMKMWLKKKNKVERGSFRVTLKVRQRSIWRMWSQRQRWARADAADTGWIKNSGGVEFENSSLLFKIMCQWSTQCLSLLQQYVMGCKRLHSARLECVIHILYTFANKTDVTTSSKQVLYAIWTGMASEMLFAVAGC